LRSWRSSPIAGFLVRRVAAGAVTVLAASVVIFIGTEILPGDAATAVLGRFATEDSLAAVREQLDLDQPAVERYVAWLGDFLTGDLGDSAAGRSVGDTASPVSDLIGPRIVNSAILAGVTALILIPLGIFLGALAATRADRPLDHAVSSSALVAIALPEFVTGTVLILIFAAQFGLLPAVSLVPADAGVLSRPEILVLPVLTLLAAALAQMVRLVRANMIEVLSADYVHMARLNGLPEHVVLRRYALRNALAPSVQITALTLTWLLGGIVITENLFAYPGLGQALVQAVALRDIPFVQSVALLIAISYVVLNVLADLAVLLLVPKLRTGQ
jgi:peptide/nickel transport system permease protein